MIDLHMHSTKSDGMLEPSMLALALYNADISWAALADHDTVAGQDEFMRSCTCSCTVTILKTKRSVGRLTK